MKREEKNALARQRILDAALAEFSKKGYTSASLNTICAENDISKGIIYHHFKDKDQLYLLCAADCFQQLTAHLQAVGSGNGTVEHRLRRYFDARVQFFAEHPLYLGLFLHVVLYPPAHLAQELAQVRKSFDQLNITALTDLLKTAPLRPGLSVDAVVEDFRLYMDYFHTRFRALLARTENPEEALREHEERCHRQIGILLYGVLGETHA